MADLLISCECLLTQAAMPITGNGIVESRWYRGDGGKVHSNKSRGFVGIVFLAIVLISIVIGAFSVMSRGSQNDTADSAQRMAVAKLLKITSDYKQGVDLMVANGINPYAILFTKGTTGLFNPTGKYAIDQPPPPEIMQADDYGYSGYSYISIHLPGIGGNTTPDRAYTLQITQKACQLVNKTLYNDSLSAAPAVSSGPMSAWEGYASPALDDSANSAVNFVNRNEGCVKTSDNFFVYYKAMVES